MPNQTAKMIDIAQVQGQVHAQSVQRVGELVGPQPDRNRLHHPHLAPRKRSLIDRHALSHDQENEQAKRDIESVVAALASRSSEPAGAQAHRARSARRC